MIENLNSITTYVLPPTDGDVGAKKKSDCLAEPKKILKNAVEVYPGVEIATDTLEKMKETRLCAMPKPSTMRTIANKGKALIKELFKETKKIEKEDVVIEAGMQIKDWYDSHKVVN